jgi:SAM-dependent methyltransferase
MNNFDQQYYSDNYVDYDSHSPMHKLNFYYKKIDSFLSQSIPDPKIHDIGCAYGNFLFNLDNRFIKFGSDVSEFAILKAREKNLLTNNSINFEIIRNSSPFSEESFDLITAFDVLEHAPSPELIIETIHAQLKNNGTFMFVVPVYDGLSGPIIKKLDKDPTHLHKWNRYSWLNLISKKFHVLEWQGIFRYNFFGLFYVHLPSTLMRNHTPAIIVICRKK